MTTQEYIQKEAKEYWLINETKDPEENFSDGLTKGIELAKEFAEWEDSKAWEYEFSEQRSLTTAELLEIFLNTKI